jgi:hypothetical protein
MYPSRSTQSIHKRTVIKIIFCIIHPFFSNLTVSQKPTGRVRCLSYLPPPPVGIHGYQPTGRIFGALHNQPRAIAEAPQKAAGQDGSSAHVDTKSNDYHTELMSGAQITDGGKADWRIINKTEGQVQTAQGKERRTESVMNKPALQGFRIHNPL